MSGVKFENVGKTYAKDQWAVRDFTLDIKDGEFVSFLGPSGCGKTTTLRMIAGLEENTHGRISFEGKTVSDPQQKLFTPPEKRHVGMMFQSYAVWPH
jgi:iron(III) transport system ATP-binding protein